ncbi:MAG: hypothetical protein LBR72_01530 [Oscillospiraceae bacterium]|jgi:hypothetical protein|nr:hypothetical protein [Oscillospiraceae bacterium]
MKKILGRILIGGGILIVLLTVLSLTVLNGQFKPNRETVFMRAGRLAAADRDYTSAIDYYRMAIGLDRRNTEAYRRLAESCVYDNDVESALYYLELGIEHTGSEALREALNALLAEIAAQEAEQPPPPPETDISPAPMPSPAVEPSVAEAADPGVSPDISPSSDALPDPGAEGTPDVSPYPSPMPEPSVAGVPEEPVTSAQAI